MKKILLTGGAGYIATHIITLLYENGYEAVLVDNFSNSNIKNVHAVEKIVGCSVKCYEDNCQNYELLDRVFTENEISAVIHLAGFKAVGESCAKPLMYYVNNLNATFTLLDVMKKHNVKNLIFSSSATVYGIPTALPLDESMPVGYATNPYGQTKCMIERILDDVYSADKEFHIVKLRYFNPVGAHFSGLIGESPNGIPNNLMPFICDVASGKRQKLSVFGADYPTHDGTGERDYIHVLDLALGHVKALQRVEKFGCDAINLGAGIGYSVLDVINTFEKVNNIKVPYEINERRAGDVASVYCTPKKAKELLDWEAKYDLAKMCESAWNYYKISKGI